MNKFDTQTKLIMFRGIISSLIPKNKELDTYHDNCFINTVESMFLDKIRTNSDAELKFNEFFDKHEAWIRKCNLQKIHEYSYELAIFCREIQKI